MNYQNQRSCQDGAVRSSCGCGNNTWRIPRSTDCSCGSNTWRIPRSTDCGCGSNTWRIPRSTDCGCGSNTWRTPRSTDCGCGSNTWRTPRSTDCGYGNTVAEACSASDFASQRNAGTVWKNRSSCGCNGVTVLGTTRSDDCGCKETVTVRSDGCGCNDAPCAAGASEDCALSGRSLAMVYSPHQKFQSLYDPREGLCRGTVFCELDKPFYGSGRGC